MKKMPEHTTTESERKCLREYRRSRSDTPRRNLIELIRHINRFNPLPSEDSWEYIFFDRQLTDEMVDFALKMKLRHPYQMAELADVEDMPLEETAKMADELAHIGLLEYCSDDEWGDTVVLPVFMPGSMENAAMTKEQTDAYPEMAPAYLNYINELEQGIADFIPKGCALMRTIPVEDAIKDHADKDPREELSHWLDEAGESLAVSPCTCRKFRRMCKEGTADLEGDWCIELGTYAENCIRVGKARRITREEAEAILKHAEELGYVHQLSNIDGPDSSRVICNCSWDTCVALKASWYTQTPNLSSSNYRAKVEKEKCTACGRCVDVCPQNAIRLGQRLCQKDPVKIREKETPEDHLFFGKEHWQPDFLIDRARVVPETGTSPCVADCPAHMAVQGCLKMAADDRKQEALALLKKENPFPAVCGACPRYCEQSCIRGELDVPAAAAEVNREIARQDLDPGTRCVPEKRFNEGKKIAVIGSGPAGLSCAYYLALWGHPVTVFEKADQPGGMMTYGMPAFRVDRDVIRAEIEVVRELGVEIRTGVEVGKDVTIPQLREQGYAGFYAAIGSQGSRKLGVPGEEARGVLSGLDFLRQVEDRKNEDETENGSENGKLSGKVLVIGGGGAAVDVARTALRCGADCVNIFCLEDTRREMPAAQEALDAAMKEQIPVHGGWGPKEILTENGHVTGVRFQRCTAVKDAGSRFKPQYDEDYTMVVNCDYVLTAIGQTIEWGDLLEGSRVKLCRNLTVQADPFTQQTDEPDIFVGGDARTGARSAIEAIEAGKEGAESLHRYVWEGHTLTLGRVKQDNYRSIDPENLKIEDYDPRPGSCLDCGTARVDENICIGCGLCVTRCEFDAVSLVRTGDDWGVPYEELVGQAAKDTAGRVGRSFTRSYRRRQKEQDDA